MNRPSLASNNARWLRRHGVSLADHQIDTLVEVTAAWNRYRRTRHLPALTPYQVLSGLIECGRDFLLGRD